MSWISKFILKILGWKVINDLPNEKKYMLIAAPHTSNWDFPLGLLVKFAEKVKLNYLGKGALFDSPFGWFFRALGGIPVYRKKRLNMVDQMVDQFNQREHMILAMSPEGTRSYLEYWKSGFYHIAHKAKVPIAMATLDFGNKLVRLGNTFMPSGDIQADMQIIRAFFEGVKGKKPQNQGPIQVKS
ncbi:lysophospholipid acyltransferase family protein [Marinicella meishanensis]|uniref:lysophospholipid acyltransferase family protein n=1 Tax=Marinicella meishanensis TaxID=2873263 RepID=UPI001CC184F9|nr:lysophospholipid acyltransferase family protein [Marinicella sp. NBU2979]